MIDMHVHVADPGLPGSKPFPDYFKDAQATAVALEAHMQASGVTQVLAMGSLHTGEHDPLGVHMSLRVAALLDGVFVAGVIDPRKTDDAHFERVEAVLQTGKLKALKAYLGYLHFGPEHPNYRRYYALAARYQLPVVFHTGDTYALKAKVKYAHPLRVDEVAVDYPGVSFVMAHTGCPWLDTAAEVIYKNDNVWADVSGLFVGDEAYQQRIKASGFLDAFAARLRYAVLYTEKPEKFLYGSDWPLAPMQAYHASVIDAGLDELIPGLFHDNARALFNLP